MKKLKKVISQNGTSQISITPKISLATTLEKFNQKKEITLQDLQLEVKNIKKEIIALRQLSSTLQVENFEIKQDLVKLMEN